MDETLGFFIRSLTGWVPVAMAFSVAGMGLAAAMGRAGVFGAPALRNSAVSILFWLSNITAGPVLVPLLALAGNALFAAGWPRLPPDSITGQPFWVQLLLFSLIYDFTEYWAHRWLHTAPGWPIHAIHHSDTTVNGFTTFRVHALEPLLVKLMGLVTLGWVGFPADVIGAGIAINLLHNAYVHFDVDWDHGPLRWLIASPRFHRLHHLDAPEVHHRNLANIYPIWDLLFGTWHGTGQVEGRLGASMAGVPDTDFVRLWLWPFRAWAGMVGGRVRVP